MLQPILEVSLEYCVPCDGIERAFSLTSEILGEREIAFYIASWTLIPGNEDVFEVVVNGELVFSKTALGRHPEPGEVRAAILDRVDALKSLPDEQTPDR